MASAAEGDLLASIIADMNVLPPMVCMGASYEGVESSIGIVGVSGTGGARKDSTGAAGALAI